MVKYRLHMNKAKISGLVVEILVFLLMNFFDRQYLSPIADVLDDTWTQKVFGIDTTEEKKLLSGDAFCQNHSIWR